MSNDGQICLHPRTPERFIWMAISERGAVGQIPSAAFVADRERFLGSLKFVD